MSQPAWKHPSLFRAWHRRIFTLIAIPFIASACWAQQTADVQQGLPPYSTFQGNDIDSVNLLNGKLSLHVPLISYPERGGKLHVGFFLSYQNTSVSKHTTCAGYPQTCTITWGGGGTGVQITADFADIAGFMTWGNCTSSGECYAVSTPDGSVHEFAPTTDGLVSMDATGFHYDSTSGMLIDRNGIRYEGEVPGSSVRGGLPTLIADPNGNEMTPIYNSNGNIVGYTDAMGRSIPFPPEQNGVAEFGGLVYSSTTTSGCTGPLATTAAYLWSLPGINGGTAQFKVCIANLDEQYNPGDCSPSLNNCYPFNETVPMIQSIVLPNLTAWTFEYDTIGNLAKVIYPTGDSISYAWAQSYFCGSNTSSTPTFYYSVKTRTVNANDGKGPHTWTYSGDNGFNVGYPAVVTATDPLGDQTVHTFNDVIQNQLSCNYYETQTQFYRDIGGTQTLLKTANTAYMGNASPFVGSIDMNVAPIRITTTWPNGMVSEVDKTYDAGEPLTSGGSFNVTFGNVTEEDDYDYGNGSHGALLKRVDTSYLALSNSTYLANNLVSLPGSVAVYNGSGAQEAYTSYGYDEFSLSASGISTQHDSSPSDGINRGNLTSTYRLLTGNSSATPSCPVSVSDGNVVGHKFYYDTGEVYQSKDPCGNPTTYSYSSTFAGAYPTQITNAKGQSTSYDYDFNTGLLLSATDPNNQSTSYSYDIMRRLTETVYPDGGQVTNCYSDLGQSNCSSAPEPNVKTVQLISNSPSLNKITTAVLDGLGRLLQTQNSDPQGIVYADTTYDALGRVATVSSPYRTTSDPTYGVMSYAYDALGRKTQVTYADGSTISTVYSGNCTTVTDEEGKSRESCTDGLGRLATVIEDPGGLGYTTSYGRDARGNLISVVQNGSHPRSFSYDSLSRLTVSSNPESGTVNYSYDVNGNVTQTADSRGMTVDYQYDVLNRMTEKIDSDTQAPTAYFYDGQQPFTTGAVPGSGSVTISGTEGQYTVFLNSCCLYDHGVCVEHCTEKVWDTGTVSITVNGSTESTGFGQSSTSSSIASALGSAINGNSSFPVTASVSGTTISLVSKSAGSGTNYSLSTSVSSHAGSFAASASGSTLTGGKNNCNVSGTSLSTQNGILRRSGVCDAAGSEAWSYDSMGRILEDQRTTNGVTGTTKYAYNLFGSITTITYPSGLGVSYGYDAEGRQASATRSGGGAFVTGSCATGASSNGACYAPQGALSSLTYSDSTQMNESFSYNKRLQPVEMKAWSSSGTAMDLTYNFNLGTGDNGNVVGITNNVDGTRTETLSYDSLNRLVTAKTQGTSGSNCFGVQFSYDPWGNLTATSVLSGYTSCSATTPYAFSISIDGNNRVTTSGFSYDAAGNAQSDGISNYGWNAESELTSAAGVNYTYDGDGDRVEKSNGTLYWYGLHGEVLEETSLTGALENNYVFFNGQRVLREDSSGNDYYFSEDQLGSSRVIFNSSETKCYDADFLPFGQEVDYTSSCGSNYKFEGKERDTETGNDNFGARYYRSALGRWLSPDWSAIPVPVPYADLTNPQTLNLYAMVRDNPETFADLNGHLTGPGDTTAVVNGCTITGGTAQSDCSSQTQNQTAAQQQMSLSSKGLDFIKSYEKLSLKEYKDQAGYETIGYGHKVLPGEDFSKGVTKAQALALLKSDVGGAVKDVNAALKVSATQNQFDALVSLRFNAGQVSVLPGNEMMRAVNAGSVTESNFTAYRYVHVNGKAVVSQGLLNRREAEWQMFSGGGP